MPLAGGRRSPTAADAAESPCRCSRCRAAGHCCRRRCRCRRPSCRRRRCVPPPPVVAAAGAAVDGDAAASWSRREVVRRRGRCVECDIAMLLAAAAAVLPLDSWRTSGGRGRRSATDDCPWAAPRRRGVDGRRRARPTLTMMSPNCSGVAEPAQRVDRQLERTGRRGAGGWPIWPGRRIQVLVADGVGHVDGGHVARRHFLRIEPGADAVVALPLVGDVRNAVARAAVRP